MEPSHRRASQRLARQHPTRDNDGPGTSRQEGCEVTQPNAANRKAHHEELSERNFGSRTRCVALLIAPATGKTVRTQKAASMPAGVIHTKPRAVDAECGDGWHAEIVNCDCLCRSGDTHGPVYVCTPGLPVPVEQCN